MRAEPAPAERLASERTAALEAVAALRREVDAIVAASVASNADDEHDPEGATVAYERARVQAALDAARARVAELDAALARVGDGTYGVCQRCGRPIAAGRLDALPAATLCLACASGGPYGRS